MTDMMIEALTERERDILSGLVEGLSNQEIANRYHISVPTVKWYNNQIYGKLNVSSRQEASKLAHELNLLEQVSDPAQISHNLPQHPTKFIGRETEIHEISQMLSRADTRLITIVAPGGMGKTRLSLEVAMQSLARFPDGVFVVKYAQMTTADNIIGGIASLFELEDSGDARQSFEEQIASYLRDKQILLVLDNLEHLIADVQRLSGLIQATEHLTILATSRERLKLQWEQVYVLKGMAVASNTEESVEALDAMQLFLQAAQRVQADYQLTETDVPHILRICQLAGGMPLGMELAAGWMNILTAKEIADEIEQRLDILETDMQDIPERHRSVNASLQQTWNRLSEQERELMMYMSVFVGGFTREAAESVIKSNLRVIHHLSNKALIYQTEKKRYEIHELVRQFSFNKLEEAGLKDDALRGYVDYFVTSLKAQVRDFLEMKDSIPWIAEVNPDMMNIIEVIKHISDMQRFDDLQEILLVVHVLIVLQSGKFARLIHYEYALEKLHPLLDDNPQWDLLRGQLMYVLAQFSTEKASREESASLLKASIEVMSAYEPHPLICYATFDLGSSYFWHTPPKEKDKITGYKYVEKAVKLAIETGEKHPYAFVLNQIIPMALEPGRRDEAEQYLNELKTLTASVQEDVDDTFLLESLGHVYFYDKDYARARECFLALLEKRWRIHNIWIYGNAHVLQFLCNTAVADGNIKEAKQYVLQAIHLHRDHARDWQIIGVLYGIFVMRFLIGIEDYLYAIAVLSFVKHQSITVEFHRENVTGLLETLYDKVDAEDFDAAYEHGKQMKLNQVLEDALAYLSAE